MTRCRMAGYPRTRAVGIPANRRGGAMKRIAVRLPDVTHDRLRALAARSGRTATFYIREAIERHLEDLEDLHAAEKAAAEHRETGGRTLSLDELDNYLSRED